MVALVGSATVAVAAFVAAGTLDGVALRVIAAIVGLGAAVVGVRAATGRSRTAALVGAVVLPALVLAVGTPVAAVIASEGPGPFASESGGGSSDDPAASIDDLDLDAQLAEALDHADRLAANGSSSILSMQFGTSTSVDVLDRRTGDRLSSSRSGDTWSDPSSSRATSRDVYRRADLTGLSLSEAAKTAVAGARKLGDTAEKTADTIQIERRDSDKKLLLTFDSDDIMRDIQVDTRGRLPDTLDAGSVDTVMASATRIMEAAGLDAATTKLNTFDFQSIEVGSDVPGASAVQSSGGIAMEFDDGPLSEIVAVPGEFPELSERTTEPSPQENSFTVKDVPQRAVSRARDDLIRRRGLAAYDKEVVGFQVEAVSNDDGDRVTAIRMNVGAVRDVEGGVYTLAGRFVRDGTS